MPRGKRICKKLLKKRIKALLTSIIPYETNFLTVQNHTTPLFISLTCSSLPNIIFHFPYLKKCCIRNINIPATRTLAIAIRREI